MRTSLLLALTCSVALAAISGCRPKDQIRTYRIAKPVTTPATGAAERPTAPIAAPEGPPTHRMIGSILRGPSQAWFFKAVGPKETLDASAEAIRDFLASVRFEGDQPTWDTPEGWGAGPEKPMRLATLTIPADGSRETELSVIGLPLTGDWRTQVLDNVNRWRKQLAQPPLTAATLAEGTSPLPDAGEDAVLFDELGRFDGGGMAPFANRNAPFANRQAPPTPSRSSSGPPPSSRLKYTAPEGWTTDREPNPMRKASLTTTGGATARAFVFAAAGVMGDPLENANRWRGEVGLPATTQEELDEASEEIDLLGQKGQRFDFVGEEEATAAAMVQLGQGVWFFKLRGPKDEVAAQSEAFDAWLASMSL